MASRRHVNSEQFKHMEKCSHRAMNPSPIGQKGRARCRQHLAGTTAFDGSIAVEDGDPFRTEGDTAPSAPASHLEEPPELLRDPRRYSHESHTAEEDDGERHEGRESHGCHGAFLLGCFVGIEGSLIMQ